MTDTRDPRPTHVDYDVLLKLIEPPATVLDLGCGNGELLERLAARGIRGRGVDIEERSIIECLSRGLSVFQGNLDEGLRDYASGAYDYVILNQTLQVVTRPTFVLREMLRVGQKAIVSFPNFGHLRVRLQLLLTGRMPVTGNLPYQWYETPNIHTCTRRDFIAYCSANGIDILDLIDLARGRRIVPVCANIRASEVMFVLRGAGVSKA